MDRILTRIDHEGNAVVFLPESYKNGKLLCWYGQSNQSPEYVSMEYYKSTKPLSDDDTARIKKQYEKALANGPVQLMERFPRGLLSKMQGLEQSEALSAEGKANAQSAGQDRVPANPVVRDKPANQAEQAHYKAMRAVRAGNLWRVVDEQGQTREIVATEGEALKALEQSLQMAMH